MSMYSVLKNILKYPCRLIYRVKTEGAENEPEGSYIVMANHSSFVDPVIITASLKQNPIWLAKKELLKNPLMRLVYKITGAIPINRQSIDTTAIRGCIDAVNNGKSLGIFPQGTRMPKVEPTPEQALAGVSFIACMTKATVLPVSIVTKARKPKAFRKTRVVFHKPVPYSEYSSISEKPGKQEMTEYLFARVCEEFKNNG